MQIPAPNNVCAFRRRFTVAGQVQGVGFRPFVYRLAARGSLTGTVGNTSEGVRIEVQGSAAALDAFGHALRHELPPLARLTACTEEDIPVLADESAFRIIPSQGHGSHSVLVSPDMGICPDCLRDMCDSANRRWRYAFTNCTNCGPRYTITRSIPYDRAVTSMHCFPLCPNCAAEYGDPLDRRFHAQPNACPVCGPRLWLVETGVAQTACPANHARAKESASSAPRSDATQTACPTVQGEAREALAQAALARAAALLCAGKIVAIKGLGGFLLACDATCEAAVRTLRERKQRPHKPFAVMAADIADARRVARLSPEAEALLTSPEKPIVLCRKRGGPDALPDCIAPDVAQVGLMLPYTPLHVALFAHCGDMPDGPRLLVMTSGNAGGEPICLGNREALARLEGMADAFLLHDRDILVRADDSVLTMQEDSVLTMQEDSVLTVPEDSTLAVQEDSVLTMRKDKALPSKAAQTSASTHNTAPLFFRRARGYVPRPIALEAQEDAPCVLACGPELKATLCLTRGNEAFVSQHLGDLHTVDTFRFFEEVAQHMEHLLEVRPAALVCDAHPDFMSTRYAQERAAAEGIPCISLQHHAAHAASVLTENHISGPALALTLDGTGLGTDGSIWGGELLWMDLSAPAWRRLGRLSPFALPGGDAAVREPWRIAQALLWQLETDAAASADQSAETTDAHARAGQHCCPTPIYSTTALADMPHDACPHSTGTAASCHSDTAFTPPWQETDGTSLPLLRQMVDKKINCPRTSSCGRLFDAVSALLGLCQRTTYEGQAAIRLEAALPEEMDWKNVRPCACVLREYADAWEQADAERAFLEQADAERTPPEHHDAAMPQEQKACPPLGLNDMDHMPLEWDNARRPPLELDSQALFAAVLAEKKAGRSAAAVSASFHLGLALGLADMAACAARRLGLRQVGLSGGVLQNATLSRLLSAALRARGLEPLTHHELPAGDGGLSLGQAAWGRSWLRRKGKTTLP